MQCLRTAAQEFPDAAGELASGQEDAASAGLTDQTDVGAHANDFPAVAPAGMGFAHLNQVAGVEFLVNGEHRQ